MAVEDGTFIHIGRTTGTLSIAEWAVPTMKSSIEFAGMLQSNRELGNWFFKDDRSQLILPLLPTAAIYAYQEMCQCTHLNPREPTNSSSSTPFE